MDVKVHCGVSPGAKNMKEMNNTKKGFRVLRGNLTSAVSFIFPNINGTEIVFMTEQTNVILD